LSSFLYYAITHSLLESNEKSYCRLLKQYLVVFCINQMASALFRLMAALGRDIVVANTAGTFALLAVTVLGGFVISRGEKTAL